MRESLTFWGTVLWTAFSRTLNLLGSTPATVAVALLLGFFANGLRILAGQKVDADVFELVAFGVLPGLVVLGPAFVWHLMRVPAEMHAKERRNGDELRTKLEEQAEDEKFVKALYLHALEGRQLMGRVAASSLTDAEFDPLDADYRAWQMAVARIAKNSNREHMLAFLMSAPIAPAGGILLQDGRLLWEKWCRLYYGLDVRIKNIGEIISRFPHVRLSFDEGRT